MFRRKLPAVAEECKWNIVNILELNNISYQYPNSKTRILKNISCKLETGRLITLLGANGSGKSTLAKVFCGILEPDSGEAPSPTDPPLQTAEEENSWNGIGLVLQNPDEQLVTGSVETELAWGLENLGVERDLMRRKVDELLDLFGLQKKRKTPPENLSDGEKQLVALGSIIIMDPDFLILDEPAAFLDNYWQNRIGELIIDLKERMGILWISTRAQDAQSSDEIWILQNGKIASSGSPIRILESDRLKEAGIAPLKMFS